MSAGDLVFCALLVVGAGGLLGGICLLTLRLSELPREGLALERRERRARHRRDAFRIAAWIGASSAVLAGPAFVWPDVSVHLTLALIVGALIVPLIWLLVITGGSWWPALGGWVACAAVLGATLWLLAGSMIATGADAGRLEQDATLAAIREIGEAFEAWRGDRPATAEEPVERLPALGDANGDPVRLDDLEPLSPDALERLLVPRYLPALPRVDGWGRPLELRGRLHDPPLLAIRSAGRDGAYSADEYSPGVLDEGALDGDLVWIDGIFVRQPAD